MKANMGHRVSKTLTSVLILVALLAATVVPALAQTRRVPAVGAGLGVAGAFLSKGHEAVVKSGTEFGVVLNQTLSLPAANVR